MKTVQNFYSETVKVAWTTGTGNFYVSTKPTPSAGWLAISPNNSSKKELIEYTATGTDGTGDYVTVSVRGVGGTTEQTHTVGEPIRMDITAEYWADIYTDPTFTGTVTVPTPSASTDAASKGYADGLAIAGSPDASTSTKGISKMSVAPTSATNPIAVGDNDNRVSPVDLSSVDAGKVDALVGTSGTPSSTNKFVTNDDTSASAVADKVVRYDSSGNLKAQKVILSVVAGEDISAGDAVFLSSGNPIKRALISQLSNTQNYNTGFNIGYSSVNYKAGQVFTAKTTSINSVYFISQNRGSSGSINQDITIEIFNTSGGLPAGSAIYSETIPTYTLTAYQQKDKFYTFITKPTLVIGTTYAITFKNTNVSQGGIGYSNIDVISNSNAVTFDGTTWTAQANYDTTIELITSIDTPTEGNAYISSGNINGEQNNIFGVADTSVTSSNSFNVIVSKNISGYTFGDGSTTVTETTDTSITSGSTAYTLYTGVTQGQSFRTNDISNITKISIELLRVGTGAGDITLDLYDLSGDKIIGSGTILSASISVKAFYDVTFTNPIPVKPNHQYYFIVNASAGDATTNYYSIYFYSSDVYTSGVRNNNGTWDNTTDLNFKIKYTSKSNWSFGDLIYLSFGTPVLSQESSYSPIIGKIINNTTILLDNYSKDNFSFKYIPKKNTTSPLKLPVEKNIRKIIITSNNSSTTLQGEIYKNGITSVNLKVDALLNSSVTFNKSDNSISFSATTYIPNFTFYFYN